jgi:hypothetical protein
MQPILQLVENHVVDAGAYVGVTGRLQVVLLLQVGRTSRGWAPVGPLFRRRTRPHCCSIISVRASTLPSNHLLALLRLATNYISKRTSSLYCTAGSLSTYLWELLLQALQLS